MCFPHLFINLQTSFKYYAMAKKIVLCLVLGLVVLASCKEKKAEQTAQVYKMMKVTL